MRLTTDLASDAAEASHIIARKGDARDRWFIHEWVRDEAGAVRGVDVVKLGTQKLEGEQVFFAQEPATMFIPVTEFKGWRLALVDPIPRSILSVARAGGAPALAATDIASYIYRAGGDPNMTGSMTDIHRVLGNGDASASPFYDPPPA